MVDVPNQQGKDPRPARTRSAILAAADQLLGTRGVEGTTMARIAATSGVSVGSIYAHFGSKSDLIAALGAMTVRPRVERLEQGRDQTSPLDRIVAAGDAYVRLAIDEPSTFNALTILAHEPPSTDAAGTGSTELASGVADLLQSLEADLLAAMEAGEVRQAPVKEALVALLATWNGIADLVARRDGLAISEELAWSALAASHTLVRTNLPAERPFAPVAGEQAA